MVEEESVDVDSIKEKKEKDKDKSADSSCPPEYADAIGEDSEATGPDVSETTD